MSRTSSNGRTVGGAERPAARWRRVTARSAEAMTLLFTVTTLAGFLGAHGWLFDLVANLRPQQALALVLLTGVLVVTGSGWTALVAGAAAMINILLVSPFLVPASLEATAIDAETLELLLLNVKVDEAEPAAVIREISVRDPDVVVLVATTPEWIEALQAAELPLYIVSGAHLTRGLEVAVLTREPPARVRVHKQADDMRSALVEVGLELDGEPLQLLATHPVSPMTPERARQRDRQLAWVGSWAQQQGPSVLVVGDLNVTPWSAAYGELITGGGLNDPQRVHGLQPSWPASLGPLGLPIDHVLHGSDLTTLSRELGPSFGSDHRSVVVRIARRMSGQAAPGR
jgi:endonuclease/exonuclease/phosphatase (EEP) superfamily protein YafD